MSTEADTVTPEMLRALVTSDHKRGCQGREYGCSCGYDDEKDAMIERAADALEKLRAERDAAARDMRERCAKVLDEMSENPSWAPSEQDASAKIAEILRALPDTPAMVATDRETL